MKELMRVKGFIPFVFMLFINAAVDVGHKITIQNVLLKSFEGDTLIILSAFINAMILFPFVFLFSPSGYLSNHFSKTIIARYASLAAIVLTLLITLSYYLGFFYIAFGFTFLLAAQSAIYSPSKFGLIKEIFGVESLGAANGVVQAVTITAILFSSIFFSIIFEGIYEPSANPNAILQSIAPVGWLLVIVSIIEFALSFKLPVIKAANIKEHFEMQSYFHFRYFKENMQSIRSDYNIWLSIIGLSVFWGIGQVIIAVFPAHYKMMSGDENAIVIQAILAASAIGIAIGSIVAGRASRLHIELGVVPLGAVGLFVSLLMFTTTGNPYFMAFSSILFGFFGGLFAVPLNASIQYFAPSSKLGTILAGKNFIQNATMILFLSLSILLVILGFHSSTIFILSATILLAGSLLSIKKLPHLFARLLLLPVLKNRYSLAVKGLHNLPPSGGVLLLGNHISWIDWLVVQVASPRAVKFVMAKSIYDQWYIRWFVNFFKVIPISRASGKDAIKQIQTHLDNGEVIALFPEGRISYNGQLGEFKKGYEVALKDTKHPIVPFYICGLWGSTFSRAKNRFKRMTKDWGERSVVVSFGSPLPSDTKAEHVKQAVKALSYETWEEQMSQCSPLQHSWLYRAKGKLLKRSIVDATGADLNNAQMLRAVLLFAKEFKTFDDKNIGVILPASAIGSIVNMALFVAGKCPINLNYTLSSEAINSAIGQAQIKTIITSEHFTKKLQAKGFDLSDVFHEEKIMVENLAKSFTSVQKITASFITYLMPPWLIEILCFSKTSIDDTATILFSSGSEGSPKGVELTHKNLLANIKQTSALLNFQYGDVILNSLPIFHSFGLTITTLLPLCEGVTMVSAPDPTDAASIGKLAVRYQPTIMFGTSTFFRLYTKNPKLHPLMFKSIRMVVAGAEKLKVDTKRAFKEKFGIDIFEGYGTTETSPVISVNMPDALEIDSMQLIIGNKIGTVGQALPGTIVKIVDPQSYEELPLGEDGLIIVGGPQVMKGYLNEPKKTKEVIKKINDTRYYITGDKGHVDSDGFITIVGRYSRFAKIGGEMIPLGNVEENIEKLFDASIELIAVSLEDEKKGEKIVVLYKGELPKEEIATIVKKSDIPPLMQPAVYLQIEDLPKLASGKSDFNRAKKIAQEMLDANS
ncbi:MAG: acyl-[ACP]--phospholipid O-acyltransferase [Campylobacterales bacterium]|nr:acyl-[ACP]--phospholipid O-acyltransferase [Campylobacterales bacterium]